MTFSAWLDDRGPSVATLAAALRSSAADQRRSAAACGDWPDTSATGWAILARQHKQRAVLLDQAADKLEDR